MEEVKIENTPVVVFSDANAHECEEETQEQEQELEAVDDVDEADPAPKPKKPAKEYGSPVEELSRVLSPEIARAVVDHRVAIKAKLTGYAAWMLANELEKWPSPDDGARMMISRVWRGFKVSWMENALREERGHSRSPPKPRTIFDAIDDFTGSRNDDPGCITIDHHDGATVAAPVRRLANSPWD